MLRPDLFDRYDMERRIHERLFCFGSGDADEGSGGGSDVSDEDLDESLQQDIAAAAVFQNQGSRPLGNYNYMLPDNDDTNALINATSDILTAAATAPPRQMQQAVNTGTAFAAQRPGVADALVNAAMTPLPPERMRQVGASLYRPSTVPPGMGSVAAGGDMDVPTVANFVVGAPNLPPEVVTGQNRETFDTTSGEIIPPPASPAELFRAQESNRAMGLDQRQAGFDAYQAMLNDAVAAAQSNIDSASEGLLGAPTRVMNQMFIDGLNTRIGNRDGAAYQAFLNDQNLFAPVYNQAGRLTGYRDQFGRLTGTDPIADLATGFNDESDETTPPVTNPLTGASRCPDGFIFDEGLQTCRRKTTAELAETGSGGSPAPMASGDVSVVPQPGDIFYRRSILDDAPANLPQGFDFDAANRRFIQSYGVRPENYRMPLSLTGFTAL